MCRDPDTGNGEPLEADPKHRANSIKAALGRVEAETIVVIMRQRREENHDG